MIHVHVYRIGPFMAEVDVDTNNEQDAKEIALNAVVKPEDFDEYFAHFKGADCNYIAVIPTEG